MDSSEVKSRALLAVAVVASMLTFALLWWLDLSMHPLVWASVFVPLYVVGWVAARAISRRH